MRNSSGRAKSFKGLMRRDHGLTERMVSQEETRFIREETTVSRERQWSPGKRL